MSQDVDVIKAALKEANSALTNFINNDPAIATLSKASDVIVEAIKSGGKIISCGNGGSMSDAMHFAEEMTGRFRKSRAPYPAIAISDPALISCIANDYGYEYVFSRFVESTCSSRDVLLAISTSGNSKNVIEAVKVAKSKNMKVIGLTGTANSQLTSLSDVAIVTSFGKWADRVQEMHIKCIHILIELIERKLSPELYD